MKSLGAAPRLLFIILLQAQSLCYYGIAISPLILTSIHRINNLAAATQYADVEKHDKNIYPLRTYFLTTHETLLH